jgi:trk system potassium uptake protein TrkH
MHLQVTAKVLGILLVFFSATMVPPILIAFIYDESYLVFLRAFGITFSFGATLWVLFSRSNSDMRTKEGFLITVFFYIALGAFGAIPFVDSNGLNLALYDGLFESFSGLTTTGATVIQGLDQLPKSILYYRQQLQWLGGMGIIVLAVAILPMLGIGGMQLYRAETPGPVKDSKLTPRIKETALALWSIYIGLTVICGAAYWLAGMSLFDSICHSFSTIAIGGFSTHDASIGYFDSPIIESVGIIFMLVASLNFALHFFALKEKTIAHYFIDDEVKFFVSILLASIALVTFLLWRESIYQPNIALRMSTFEVVSIFTTTGFSTAGFSYWPSIIPLFIFLGAFTGACAGSTGGGMKVIRVLLIWKQGIREVHRLIHPHAVFPVKVNHRHVPTEVMQAVWGFFSIYVVIFIFIMLALMFMGLDFLSAFSAVGATINNLGPGLGTVAESYQNLPDIAKLLLCFSMALGRLEIFTLLVLFSPMFWKK